MRISEPSPKIAEQKRLKTERQQARESLKQRLAQATQPSQVDINELVMMLAREHGLIE